MICLSRTPHHRARASAMASHTVTNSAIPTHKPKSHQATNPSNRSDWERSRVPEFTTLRLPFKFFSRKPSFIDSGTYCPSSTPENTRNTRLIITAAVMHKMKVSEVCSLVILFRANPFAFRHPFSCSRAKTVICIKSRSSTKRKQ